jgi:hypothetical protein
MLVLGQVLCSMGLAFIVPARSIVTSMVDKKHLAALYTTMSVLIYGGLLTGGPLFATAFSWGLEMGGFWLGTPFLVASGCFALASLAVSTAPTTRVKSSGTVRDEESDGLS